MNVEKIKGFILNYLQREYDLPENINPMELNYIESGYVNSMGLIQFIITIEDEFDITFSDDDLANPEIRIVGKLIEIISRKIKGN